MEPHGVPSGGDWGLERLGALYFEGTEGLSVRGCQFERLDVRPHSLCLFSLQLTLVRLSSFVVLLWSNCAVCFGHSTLVTDATRTVAVRATGSCYPATTAPHPSSIPTSPGPAAPPSQPVSRHDIAAIWVAFFSRCQRYRCLTGNGSNTVNQAEGVFSMYKRRVDRTFPGYAE